MDKWRCDTTEELDSTLNRYGPGVLYRGQIQHYPGIGDRPSLSTSFQRSGCEPDLMIKWTYYAKRALQHLVRGWEESGDVATNQAILQHYGFRSFFLDASGNPMVAAWFASHKFESQIAVNMVEDCFEDPVWLRTVNARFVPAENTGHLYLISQKALRKYGLQAVHLSEIATNDGTPRYVRQDAYMVGPLIQDGLPGDCILAHITAPSEVFRDFAINLNTEWLFPEPSDDPVYAELLAMPWEKLRHIPDDGIEAFRRTLELPEYSYHLRKHMPSRSAMYRPFWTRDLPPPPDYQTSTHVEMVQILCGSALYHGSSNPRLILPELNKLLESYDEISIEADGLVYHGMGTRYGKGVGVVKMPGGIVCVFEYGVDHPGLRIMEIRRFYGLHYRISPEGAWERVLHDEDCACGSDHSENFRLLGRVDLALKDEWIEHIGPGLYVQKHVDPTSDPKATWGEPY